jgi:predicted enzyme related to lactoylglutathione lyase
MSSASPENPSRSSRFFIGTLGMVFLVFNAWTFREHYLLKHSDAVIRGTVVQVRIMRRKGGLSYNVDYAYDLSGTHYEGSGQASQKAFVLLQPGGPIDIHYVPSDPAISETAEMNHSGTSLFLSAMLGFPVSLFILFAAFRNERRPQLAPPRPDAEDIEDIENTAPVELPNGIKGIAFTMYLVTDMKRARKFYEEDLGLKVARDFRGEWIEYHIWDNCFAISTMGGESLKLSADAGGTIAFEVNNVDAFVAQLKGKGIRIKIEPFSTPICRLAVVFDTEGNALTLHQRTGTG